MTRFWHDDHGATALEAAIVIPLFLVVVLMLIQIGIMVFVQTMLDNAARDASRLIEIGYVQRNGGVAAFVDQVCTADGMSAIIPSCSANLRYNVVAGNSFNFTPSATLNNTFSPGGPGQAVFVQIGYALPSMFSNLIGGWPLISSVAIQNELYQ